MLHWALIFFVVALVAALLGFRGVAGMSAQFGYLFAILAVVMLVICLVTGRGAVVRGGRAFPVVGQFAASPRIRRSSAQN
jgi:uncharacterized membrane protein YtjA (UPF0391 family)